MVRKAAQPSISAEGKPTEKTGAPIAHTKASHHVMDGIVKGIPRKTTTPMVDGLIRSACDHKMSDGMHSVKPSATKVARQEFGAVPYQDAKLGR